MTHIALIHTVKPLVNSFEPELRAVLSKRMGKKESQSIRVSNILDEYLAQYLAKHPWDPIITQRFQQVLQLAVDSGATHIMTTCSSLSMALYELKPKFPTPMYAIDQAMLTTAVEQSSRITVVATAESTLKPTANHLQEIAKNKGISIEVESQIVPGAYKAMTSGDGEEHDRLLRSYLFALENKEVVVLAQASMSAVGRKLQQKVTFPLLNSIDTGIAYLASQIKED